MSPNDHGAVTTVSGSEVVTAPCSRGLEDVELVEGRPAGEGGVARAAVEEGLLTGAGGPQLLPRSDTVRIEFAPPGQVRAATC